VKSTFETRAAFIEEGNEFAREERDKGKIEEHDHLRPTSSPKDGRHPSLQGKGGRSRNKKAKKHRFYGKSKKNRCSQENWGELAFGSGNPGERRRSLVWSDDRSTIQKLEERIFHNKEGRRAISTQKQETRGMSPTAKLAEARFVVQGRREGPDGNF